MHILLKFHKSFGLQFFLQTVFLCVALSVLELALAWSSQRPSSLCLLSAGIKRAHQHWQCPAHISDLLHLNITRSRSEIEYIYFIYVGFLFAFCIVLNCLLSLTGVQLFKSFCSLSVSPFLSYLTIWAIAQGVSFHLGCLSSYYFSSFYLYSIPFRS